MKTEKKIRTEIYQLLEKVTKANCPKIFEMLLTTDGYQAIEHKIINMIVSEHISPSACIPQIESEL